MAVTFSLFKVKAVGANTTVELLTNDLVLQSGEILKVQAATANRLHVVAVFKNFKDKNNNKCYKWNIDLIKMRCICLWIWQLKKKIYLLAV